MPKKVPDYDGFITVTRKGKKNRKLTPQDVFTHLQEPEAKSGPFDKRKFESAVEDIRNSDFFTNFKENLLCTLKNFYSNVESDYQVNLLQNVDIVCYGLGHFVSCVTARYQLAFLIILKDIVLPRAISIYDPVFSNEEKSVLEGLGLNVLDVNEEAKRTAFSKTIFFMPHCDLPLYNNLLWANWSKDSLSKLILIGNSFQQYLLDRTEKCLKEKAIYVNYASKFAREVRIVNDFKFLDVFNNLSLHCFHINALSEVPFEVWNDNTEPVYDDDDD
ncbi:SRR1-like protein [Araneus ventricosus]|uniref:SRR1-like protein n=1 Tax=Araneus ventricosus TaxID=182803 RepID=A0A4Y2LSC5_ARAVE|nr:SRR1-like protein [Araneus ventricosus]GBN16270.1 SRR1-like protein [Araneus ventricosus]